MADNLPPVVPPSSIPHNKVTAGAISGAIAIILAWATKTFVHIDVPAEIGMAFSTVLAFVVSYYVPNAE